MADTNSMLNAIAMMKQREAQERANSLNPLAILAGAIGGFLTGGPEGAAMGAVGGLGQRGDSGAAGAAQAGLGAYNTGARNTANEKFFSAIKNGTDPLKLIGLSRDTDYAQAGVEALLGNIIQKPPSSQTVIGNLTGPGFQPLIPAGGKAGTTGSVAAQYTAVDKNGNTITFEVDSPDDILDAQINKGFKNIRKVGM